MPPSTPGPLSLLAPPVVSPPSATIQWNGAADAHTYDLYRSLDPLKLGDKINVAPINNFFPPNPVNLSDNGINSVSVPPVGVGIYYRAVAVDLSGNISLPSNALPVVIESGAFVQDPVLATLVTGLRADGTLMGMLHGDPNQVRFQKRIRETGDTYPFVVLWRSDWKEDPKFKDLRMGTLEYTVSVVNNASSSIVVTNVLNRIAKLLDGDAGKFLFNGSAAVQVMSVMWMGAGPESYTDSPKLWFQDGRLRIICQLFAT